MKPVETEDCNFTYHLPGGTKENDLPCIRGAGFVTSFWRPDAEDEMEKYMLDGRVIVWVFWPNPLAVTIRVGGEARKGRFEKFVHGVSHAFHHTFELEPEERERIRDGAPMALTVDSTPPPAVAVTPYEE